MLRSSRLFAHWLVLVSFMAPGPRALAGEVSGDQWGRWTLDESPYLLVGDVYVPPGQVLTIEAGVVVRALGHYRITVDQALFLALGTEESPILFTADDTQEGWRGIRLLSASDDSVVTYCVVEYAKRYEQDWWEARGGALYIETCSPSVTNNVFRFNSIHADSYNGGGGAICALTSSAVIVGNDIIDNSADTGGGIVVTDFGGPIIRENHVARNTALRWGGGIYLGARTTAFVEENVIIGNHCANPNGPSGGGGGISSWTGYPLYLTFPTIRNNLIAFNTASVEGGGLYLRYDRAIVTGNTIVFNSAQRGGGMHVLNFPDAVPIVTSTILWGNTAGLGDQVYLQPSTNSDVSITYSNIEGGWEGVGNIDADPLFVSEGYWDDGGTPGDPSDDAWIDGDLRLQLGSDCIDTGDPVFEPQSGETDLEGHARVLCDRVDMGSYEFGIGDHNCDDAVDLIDYAEWTACITGPDNGPYDPTCEPFDFDYDGDIDLEDVAGFQAVFGGY